MVKHDEAEKLAIEKVNEYLQACGCEAPLDISRALMKLASVSGCMMVAATGQEDGIRRMKNTANFIEKSFTPAIN